MIDDKELLQLLDLLGGMLGSFGQGQKNISDRDLRMLYDVVVQLRSAKRDERERFAAWCRKAAVFHQTQSLNDEGEAGIAYAYNQIAHQLEENYLPEIPDDGK